MNNKRRRKLKNALELILQASNIVSEVRDEELDSIDNVPENLQETDRFYSMEDAVDYLDNASGYLDEVEENLNSAIEKMVYATEDIENVI